MPARPSPTTRDPREIVPSPQRLHRSAMSTSGEPDAKKQRTEEAAPSAAGDSAAAAPSEPVAQYVCTATLAAHKRAVSSVKFSSDGKWMASSSADTTVRRARAARTAHRTPRARP